MCVLQPADKQRLFLTTDGKKLLDDSAKLADAGVENDQELALTFEVEGMPGATILLLCESFSNQLYEASQDESARPTLQSMHACKIIHILC